MQSGAPESIDEYIAASAPKVRAILKKIRSTIHRAAPAAQETISYRIPAFTLHGALVYFAAFKEHIGFYPPVRGDPAIEKAVARYAGEKGNLRFPLDEPIPYDLIEHIVRYRVKQNEAKAAVKRAKKRSAMSPTSRPGRKAAQRFAIAPANRSLEFVKALRRIASPSAIPEVARFFHPDPNGHSDDNEILGVRIGSVFPVAKKFADLTLEEIEVLLDSAYYEVRMGAVSIMDFQARARRTPAEHRKALFTLYLRRHDRINNWDLVDRAAPHVIGGYLADKKRDVLYDLARSKNPWARRTAIVSTYYFIRANDLDDTFKIAALLAEDDHELVQKAVGSWLREAGKKDTKRLVAFLKVHARAMPRPMLRYAVEKLAPEVRTRYL